MSMVGAHVSSLVGVAPHRDARRCTQRCSPELAVSAGTRVTTASIACKAVRQGVQRELAFLGETTPVERQLPFSTQTNPCAGRARQPVVISAAAFSGTCVSMQTRLYTPIYRFVWAAFNLSSALNSLYWNVSRSRRSR